MPLPPPLALHPARPHSIGDTPEQQGPGELWGWLGQAGISPCRTFPWKRTCFSQDRLARLQEERDVPAPFVGSHTALQKHVGQSLCSHSSTSLQGEQRQGRCLLLGTDGHTPAPTPSRRPSPAASAVQHAGQMPAVPCQQGCVQWGIPSPASPRLGEGQRKSEPRHPGAEPEWGRGTSLERMHQNELLFQPGLRAWGRRRLPTH